MIRTVLKAEEFPAGCTDLNTGLSQVKRNDFSHVDLQWNNYNTDKGVCVSCNEKRCIVLVQEGWCVSCDEKLCEKKESATQVFNAIFGAHNEIGEARGIKTA